MCKQTSKLEWHIAESDAEWEQQQALLLPELALATNHHLRQKCHLWSVVMALLLLISAGGWWRYATQAKLRATAEELRTTVQQKPMLVVMPTHAGLATPIMNEQRNAEWWLQHAWEYSALPAPVPPTDSTAFLDVVSQTVELLDD